jgi:hypothetical protein
MWRFSWIYVMWFSIEFDWQTVNTISLKRPRQLAIRMNDWMGWTHNILTHINANTHTHSHLTQIYTPIPWLTHISGQKSEVEMKIPEFFWHKLKFLVLWKLGKFQVTDWNFRGQLQSTLSLGILKCLNWLKSRENHFLSIFVFCLF